MPTTDDITRKNKETNIAKLIGQGEPLPYVHYWLGGSANHELELPQQLATLSHTAPEAVVIEYGDSTLGIEINGKQWACEMPHKTMRPLKGMPHEVWQYLNLAMGRSIWDGSGEVNFGDSYSQ